MTNEPGGDDLPPGFRYLKFETIQDTKQIPEMLASVEINCRRPSQGDNEKITFLHEEAEKPGSFVIVGGGPSLHETIGSIKALDREGNRIVAMNDAADFLIENGVTPWGCVVWETHKAFWGPVTEKAVDIRYLVASRAHPDWCAYFRGRRIILWHCLDNIGEREIAARFDPDPIMIAGGVASGLRSIEIGRVMGYRNFHIFGMDASKGDASHAYANRPAPSQLFQVCVGGEVFDTHHSWVQSAVDFVDQVRAYSEKEKKHGNPFRVCVHGRGLFQTMAKEAGIITF